MDERIVRIIERHIGAGIPADEAHMLGLPDKDYLPISPEEKIVAHADNLLSGSKITSFEESLERFKNLLGTEHPAIERFLKLHKKIEGGRGSCYFPAGAACFFTTRTLYHRQEDP